MIAGLMYVGTKYPSLGRPVRQIRISFTRVGMQYQSAVIVQHGCCSNLLLHPWLQQRRMCTGSGNGGRRKSSFGLRNCSLRSPLQVRGWARPKTKSRGGREKRAPIQYHALEESNLGPKYLHPVARHLSPRTLNAKRLSTDNRDLNSAEDR